MSGNERIRVGLVFGGRSGEHEISIRSARSVAAAIDPDRFDLTLIGIDRAGGWHLHDQASFERIDGDAAANAKTEVIPAPRSGALNLIDLRRSGQPTPTLDVVFPLVHGTYGEDGTLQGLLEMVDLPYVGAGVLGSAIGMDKDVQKRLLRDARVPVVAFEVVTRHSWKHEADLIRRRAAHLGLPVFVKPANMGSSIGITKVADAPALTSAVEHALEYDTKVLIERGVNAREIECSVLGNDEPQASVPGEILPGADFYSYEDKYSSGSTSRLAIPADIPASLVSEVRRLAVQAFQVLELCGMARVDFFLERGTDLLYVNEVNTIPGFTSISMYPKLWESSGLSYRELISQLIALALERHTQRKSLRDRPEKVAR